MEYNKPGEMAPSDDHGFYTCQVPMPLKPLVMDITGEKGQLLYTGDDRENCVLRVLVGMYRAKHCLNPHQAQRQWTYSQ